MFLDDKASFPSNEQQEAGDDDGFFFMDISDNAGGENSFSVPRSSLTEAMYSQDDTTGAEHTIHVDSPEGPSLCGYRQFQGLADMPLAQLMDMLVCSHGFNSSSEPNDAATLATEPLHQLSLSSQAMKLRSIMRFAAEYHNALLVHHASRQQQLHCVSFHSSSLSDFLDAADVCFESIHRLIKNSDLLAISGAWESFRQARERLRVLELATKQELLKNNNSSILEQATSAVVVQMDDFYALVQNRQWPLLGQLLDTDSTRTQSHSRAEG